MRILALDQATTTGWAVGSPDRPLIASGSFKARMGLYHFPAFWIESVRSLIEEHDIEHLACEQPFVGMNMNANTVIRLYGLFVLAHLIASQHNIGITPCEIGRWRKHFFAAREYKTPRKRSGFFKKMAIDECERRGWEIGGHDEAEACGILDYALAQVCPETRVQQELL